FSITAGFIEWPHNLLNVHAFSGFVERVLPHTNLKSDLPEEIVFQGIAAAVTLIGLYFGYLLYYRNLNIVPLMKSSPYLIDIRNFFYSGWGFDYLYDAVLVRPFVWITKLNKSDIFDSIYNGIANLNIYLNRLLSVTQSGSLRWYVAGVLIGILFILTIQILL
ncbi:MAG: NADH-quinone oxidoreductase subunit L, partial [Bacteroidetes bacterium]